MSRDAIELKSDTPSSFQACQQLLADLADLSRLPAFAAAGLDVSDIRIGTTKVKSF
jgi:hypothetical protein